MNINNYKEGLWYIEMNSDFNLTRENNDDDDDDDIFKLQNS